MLCVLRCNIYTIIARSVLITFLKTTCLLYIYLTLHTVNKVQFFFIFDIMIKNSNNLFISDKHWQV